MQRPPLPYETHRLTSANTLASFREMHARELSEQQLNPASLDTLES
nr:MAG TPA: hypothetical protein [Caudoviricetes sp.]